MILRGKVTETVPSAKGGTISMVLSGECMFGLETATIKLVVPRETFESLDVGDKMAMRLVRTETAAGEKTYPLTESKLYGENV